MTTRSTSTSTSSGSPKSPGSTFRSTSRSSTRPSRTGAGSTSPWYGGHTERVDVQHPEVLRRPRLPDRPAPIRSTSAFELAYFWTLVENHRSAPHLGGNGGGEDHLPERDLDVHSPRGQDRLDRGYSRNPDRPRELDPVGRPDRVRDRLGDRGRLGNLGPLGADEVGGDGTLFDLLVAALRQRPEYVIVGEVRGVESFTLFRPSRSATRRCPQSTPARSRNCSIASRTSQ